MIFLIFGILIYILFFIFIPGVGAVSLRKKWRNFRLQLFKYTHCEELSYSNIKEGEEFLFKGRLESFKNDNIIWLNGDSLSVCVDLTKKDIYTISNNNDELYKTSWSDISSIMEGTTFYVFGTLLFKNGTPYLSDSKSGHELLVILSEEDDNIIESLLSKGRDRNEMWNNYSPYSYITGVLILIILSYVSYTSSFNKINSFYLLLMAGTPFYFIIPPGLYFYLKHRKFWELSLRFSVLSDLKRLKGHFKSGRFCRNNSKKIERLSLLFYVLGYIVNIFIAGIILFKLFQLIIIR